MTLEEVLIFFTGSDRIPPCGFPSQPTLTFLHGESEKFITASTCDLELRVPVMYHDDQEEFESMLTDCLKGHACLVWIRLSTSWFNF